MYEKFKQAGKITGKALKKGISMVKEGASYLEVAEGVEKFIKENARMAFPTNISVNNVAAHYTPSSNDKKVFKYGDVVKVDVGAHIDGYIGDTAATVDIGNKHAKLVEAAEFALKNAISVVKAGVKISDIGKEIENTIVSYGFKPIKNLQGHSIERFRLHAGLSIPNYFSESRARLKEGQIIAIEPFATNGYGYVIDAGIGNIYQVEKKSSMTNEILRHFDGLPFAERWIKKIYGDRTEARLHFLTTRKLIYSYKTLVDAKNGLVSQFEHTLLVTKDGCEILTER